MAIARPTVDRLLVIVELAYEAAFDYCELGQAEWSVLGEPIAEALGILRREARAA